MTCTNLCQDSGDPGDQNLRYLSLHCPTPQLCSSGVSSIATQAQQKKKQRISIMPASYKSDGSTKHSTKVMATLQWKASLNAIKALLPKKKRKRPTGDTISLSDTSSNKSNEPSIIDGSTGTGEAEEAADVKLSMLPFSFCDQKKKYAHYNAQNV